MRIKGAAQVGTDNGAIIMWPCRGGRVVDTKENTGKYKQKVSKRVPAVVTRQDRVNYGRR